MRVTPAAADLLFSALSVGDPVSAAVPGLPAKPVIDLLVPVASFSDVVRDILRDLP